VAKTCVFNLYGTLLNYEGLDPLFEKHFGAPVYRELWLARVLHTASALVLSERFVEFAKIGERTLETMAAERGRKLSSEALPELRRGLETLPVYPDVKAGLEVLKGAGYRLVGLTNSSLPPATKALVHAGVKEFFDEILTTDTVEAYKPALEPYLYAAEKLKAVPKQLWLVAAHAWDTTGGHQAGFKTALLLRPHHGFNENFPKPDVKAAELSELGVEIQNRDRTLLQKVFGTGKASPEARPAS